MFLICIIAIVIIDQLTKLYIQTTMTPGESIPIIPDVFHITYVQNPGAAFGILEHHRVLFVCITLFILTVFVYSYSHIKLWPFKLRLGVAVLIGGAIGNLIDRIKDGYVVDFFDFRFWPVFNIADIAIVSGVFIIIYYLLIKGTTEN